MGLSLTLGCGAGRRWLTPRRFNRFMKDQSKYERHYLLDYQIVCYLEIDLARIKTFVPPGFEPFKVRTNVDKTTGVTTEVGVFYITYMNILEGNRVTAPGKPDGIAFEELLWGVQVQPKAAGQLQTRSLITQALTTTNNACLHFLSHEDRYCIAQLPGLRFERGDISVTAHSDQGEICTLDIGSTHLSERKWMFGPGGAEVFKPQATGNPLRYDFTFWGLSQIRRKAELATDCAFAFTPSLLFGDLFEKKTELIPIEIAVSRPGTYGAQLLTRSVPYPLPAGGTP